MDQTFSQMTEEELLLINRDGMEELEAQEEINLITNLNITYQP